MNNLLEFGIERLQEIAKRWKQNFEGLIIDKEGNIETDDSEEKYVHEGEPETGIKNIIKHKKLKTGQFKSKVSKETKKTSLKGWIY